MRVSVECTINSYANGESEGIENAHNGIRFWLSLVLRTNRKMSSTYTCHIVASFKNHADNIAANFMAAYMKNKFAFLGIKSPVRKEISKPFLVANMLPERDEVETITKELWDEPWRELHYFAIDLLIKGSKIAPSERIDHFEWLIVHKSWWDTVDGIAVWLVGRHFIRYPGLIIPTTTRWMASENIWLQRTCLIFQLQYGKSTDFELMKSCIRPLANSKEFFIQKAIGWSLRQYYKTDPEAVIDFVQHTTLPKLSIREALKHHS